MFEQIKLVLSDLMIRWIRFAFSSAALACARRNASKPSYGLFANLRSISLKFAVIVWSYGSNVQARK